MTLISLRKWDDELLLTQKSRLLEKWNNYLDEIDRMDKEYQQIDAEINRRSRNAELVDAKSNDNPKKNTPVDN